MQTTLIPELSMPALSERKTTYLPLLTPLRGMAALLVLVYHASLFLMPQEGSAATQLIGKGFLWVDFFFLLSGFVMTHVYGGQFETAVTPQRYKTYLLARFARVYPLHLFTLAWAVACGVYIRHVADPLLALFQPVFDYRAIPTSLLLIQGLHLHPTPPMNTPAWSLSVEWWVYMLFPFLVRPFLKSSRLGKAGWWLGIVGLYLGLMYYIAPRFGNLYWGAGRATLDLAADFGFFRCLGGFGAGMLLHAVYRSGWGSRLFRRDAGLLASFGLVLVLMHMGAHELLVLGAFLPVILSAGHNLGRCGRVLVKGPFQRLGDWSFSIYMVHMPLLFTVWAALLSANPKAFADFPMYAASMRSLAPSVLPGWSLCLMWMAASVTVAALTYTFVEKPARRLLNRKKKAPQLLQTKMA